MAVNGTADEVEHDVRTSSIAMVDELHAKVMRWLQPCKRHRRRTNLPGSEQVFSHSTTSFLGW